MEDFGRRGQRAVLDDRSKISELSQIHDGALSDSSGFVGGGLCRGPGTVGCIRLFMFGGTLAATLNDLRKNADGLNIGFAGRSGPACGAWNSSLSHMPRIR